MFEEQWEKAIVDTMLPSSLPEPQIPMGILRLLGEALKEAIKKTKSPQGFTIGIVVLVIVLVILGAVFHITDISIFIFVALGVITMLALVTIGMEFTRMIRVGNSNKRENERSAMLSKGSGHKVAERVRRMERISEMGTKQQGFSSQELLECLERRFRVPDLKKAVFLLGIDWADLPGDNKTEKIISLVEYVQMRGLTQNLYKVMKEIIPNLDC